MDKKYELTNESIIFNGRKLYRIKSLKDFSDVKKGDLGGYIESEKNLSQEDNCWVYDDAKVYGNAQIYDNAQIYNNAEVYGDAEIYGNAKVYGHTEISGHTEIYGYAKVYEYAKIYNNAEVFEDAEVYDNAEVYGNASVYGNAKVFNYAEVSGNALIYDHAIVNRNYKIIGKVTDKFDDIIEIQNPEGRLVTAILRNGKIYYNVGCQDEINEKVFKNRIENEGGGLENNPHREYYYRIIDMTNYYFKDKINK